MKMKLQKTILTAVPNFVEFHNFKSNKLYRKIVVLQNISTSLARFQLEARPNNYPFVVIIKSKGENKVIPPGMNIKLIILFRCDALNESEDVLRINVQQGHSVIIKLRSHRDPPILKMITTSYSQYPQKKLHAVSKNRAWIFKIPLSQSHSLEEFTDTGSYVSSTSNESLSHCRKLKSFECGQCFVGEQINLCLMIKNIGNEGKFFIMSEIDWYSMHIEDITNENMLILPSFVIWPAYFTLKSEEYIFLHICFFPDAFGTHVNFYYSHFRYESIGLFFTDFFLFSYLYLFRILELHISDLPLMKVKL